MTRINHRQGITLGILLGLAAAQASGAGISDDVIRIGFITDMSGVYADGDGPGGAEAIRMAIADAGGAVDGKRIELLVADSLNKPDVSAALARDWFDNKKLDLLIGGTNSAASLAMSAVAAEKKKLFITSGAGASAFTNEKCTPYSIQYTYSTQGLARGTGSAVVAKGGRKWFFVTTDYTFGHELEHDTAAVVQKEGGQVLGNVNTPLGTSDFSSFMLQAQASGAKVLALANAGADLVNSLKAAVDFGLTRTMTPVGLTATLNDIHSLGMEATQGMYLTVPWYWNKDKPSEDWSRRFFAKIGRMPTYGQAGDYSATASYLKAVHRTGTDQAEIVMTWLKAHPVNDFFARNAAIRADGRLMNDLTLLQVKHPAESKGPWDYHKVVATIPAKVAYGPLSESRCPYLKSKS
ncbi:MAG: ABC transporter substrate-binding protein [Castellaniella sp.]|uniref:ABC transporter substrate-binding protein n=1 Tax=Castellaniella sp. TaxID=1955812 RepID=UPI0012260886|nr:ABC transporter substrate-binding protein [Castellaniella sp.]TAN30469.1 MAG: ABC transporter substrate-binding protein [Castellaniella sp.]